MVNVCPAIWKLQADFISRVRCFASIIFGQGVDYCPLLHYNLFLSLHLSCYAAKPFFHLFKNLLQPLAFFFGLF